MQNSTANQDEAEQEETNQISPHHQDKSMFCSAPVSVTLVVFWKTNS